MWKEFIRPFIYVYIVSKGYGAVCCPFDQFFICNIYLHIKSDSTTSSLIGYLVSLVFHILILNTMSSVHFGLISNCLAPLHSSMAKTMQARARPIPDQDKNYHYDQDSG